jgi:DNA-directed RNA polymerase subunit RPC12/RpoP
VVEDNRVVCRKCGFKWVVATKSRGRKDLLCVSCRAKPQKTIQYGDLRCVPHVGDLDLQLRPVDEDGLILPGVRVCGHSDCVNPKHVVADH